MKLQNFDIFYPTSKLAALCFLCPSYFESRYRVFTPFIAMTGPINLTMKSYRRRPILMILRNCSTKINNVLHLSQCNLWTSYIELNTEMLFIRSHKLELQVCGIVFFFNLIYFFIDQAAENSKFDI